MNENKIAITGFSYGSNGAWEMGQIYPDLFSCVVPICGIVTHKIGEYPNCPVWVIGSMRRCERSQDRRDICST